MFHAPMMKPGEITPGVTEPFRSSGWPTSSVSRNSTTGLLPGVAFVTATILTLTPGRTYAMPPSPR